MPYWEQLVGTQTGLACAFLLVAGLVVWTGIRLSVYGAALGARTGLGGGPVGLIFLAGVTSLPELVVSVTSVLETPVPAQGADLATGNMLGSNLFNLLILALVALLFPRSFSPEKMKESHGASIVSGLVMLAVFSLAFLLARIAPLRLPGLACGAPTLLLPIAYLLLLRRQRKTQSPATDPLLPEEDRLSHRPAARFYATLAALCAGIVGGGILLSLLGGRMALPPERGGFGLEASLIGTLFLAVSTSLPELTISLSGVRMGFLDMAIGNVLGSNMFNLLIIFAADLALRGNVLLALASPKNGLSVALILIETLLAAALLRARRKLAVPIALGMIALYVVTLRFIA